MEVVWSPLLLWWGVAAVALFWAVGAYNRLVRLRAKVLSIFASLTAQLERYAQWTSEHAPIPSPDAGPAPAGDVWTNLRAASAQFTASLEVARSKPLDKPAIAALGAARKVLMMAWQYVSDDTLATSRGDEEAATLRAEWDAITTQSQSADKALALAIEAYNQAVRQFPAVLLAWLFGFKPALRL